MSKLMTLLFLLLLKLKNVDFFSHPLNDNGGAFGQSRKQSESDTESQFSSDQNSCILFVDKPKWAHGHQVEEFVGPVDQAVRTRRQLIDEVANVYFISQIEPKNIEDANRVRCIDNRKSTSRRALFVGNNLVVCHNKKQNYVSLYTTETEYVTAGSCCTQLIWMK